MVRSRESMDYKDSEQNVPEASSTTYLAESLEHSPSSSFFSASYTSSYSFDQFYEMPFLPKNKTKHISLPKLNGLFRSFSGWA